MFFRGKKNTFHDEPSTNILQIEYLALNSHVSKKKKLVVLHAWKYLLVSGLIMASGFNLYFLKIWRLHKATILKDERLSSP